MKCKVEKTENANEVKLELTIEAQKFEEGIKKVYFQSAKYFNIPGFRKGKAPMNIVEKYYGKEIFYEDAFNEVVPDELEEALIMSDVGMETSVKIIDNLRDKIKTEKIEDADLVKQALREQMQEILDSVDSDLKLETKPSVILFVGVNGVGKTTSIGKIANNLRKEGKKVIVAAADTFRAAAVEQLEVWANRANVQLVKRPEGTDPASVVFDAIKTTKQEDADVLIIDTAGRLHNKKYLMDELIKINKVIDKELPDVSKEVLMVLDATTGQNGVSQAIEFSKITDITGIVLTKMDGTAKGGIVLSIKDQLNIPVKFIGLGEQVDDLQEFDLEQYIYGLCKGLVEEA